MAHLVKQVKMDEDSVAAVIASAEALGTVTEVEVTAFGSNLAMVIVLYTPS